MKHGKLLLPTSASLILLMIASAGAAPSMSLASFANYNLVASTSNIQSCTSANVTIAAFVCSNQPSALVTINDYGVCALSNNTRCGSLTPATITISAGLSVRWHNNGSQTHNLVSNSTLNGSLPSFSVWTYCCGSYFSQQFFKTGTYYYYDSFQTSMKGTVVVTQAIAPTPDIASFGANGPVDWNVAGLDQNDALLAVSHKINVYNQTATPQRLVYNESGVFEQSIDLGTRAESPTTLGLLQSVPFGLGFNGFNGYGYGFGGYGYPGPYGYYPGPFYSFQPVHTLWWVNGPLVNGSVVELLTGYASVTGSKSIPLGSGLGTQDAWTITTVYAQSSNQAQPQSSNNFYYCPYPFPYYGGPGPQPQCYVSQSSFSVSLSADYGQHSDLLFGFSSTISSLTQTTTEYPAGSTVFGSTNGAISLASSVSIVRSVSSKLTLTLSLSNTNLDLSKRMALQPTQSSSSTGSTNSGGNGANSASPAGNLPFNMTMIYFLSGAGIAVLSSGALWAISRNRRKSTLSPAPLVPVTTP